MELLYQKFDPRARTPVYATEGAAAADLYALCPPEGICVQPGKRAIIPTGIGIQLPGPGYVGLVFARSSLGIRHGLALSNGVGVIDSDYRGPIQVGVVNLGDEPYTISDGERIAQLAVMPVCTPRFALTEEMSPTARGTGGLGSTGKTGLEEKG